MKPLEQVLGNLLGTPALASAIDPDSHMRIGDKRGILTE